MASPVFVKKKADKRGGGAPGLSAFFNIRFGIGRQIPAALAVGLHGHAGVLLEELGKVFLVLIERPRRTLAQWCSAAGIVPAGALSV
jgi:hypothetical protein